MKRKCLALLLVVVLIAITISTGLPTVFASGENLLTNGDFANYSGNAPTGWSLKPLYGGATAQIVEDVKINDSLTANAWKITTPTGYDATVGSEDTRVWLKHDAPFDIKKSANYTTTFWVKVKNIKDFSLYLYETNNSTTWQSGDKLYTLDAEQADKDVRTDIYHKVQIDGGNNLQNATTSLYEDKSTLVTSYNDQWVKIVHTFATEYDDAHAAKATYGFIINQAAGGEFWLADVKTTVVEDVPEAHYTPKTNDASLGLVNSNIPLVPGKKVKLVAEPFGEHTFDGWYKGTETTPVSTELEYSFVYDSGVTPDYTAKFTKADFCIENGGYENSTTGQVANVAYNSFDSFTDNGFTSASKDNLHFAESNFTGTWRNLSITSARAHTGTKSLMANATRAYYGRKVTGLQKNAQYVLSVYAYIETTGTTTDIYTGYITGGTTSPYIKNGSALAGKPSDNPDVLFSKNYYWDTLNGANAYRIGCANQWKRIDINFNSGNNTEAIVWFYPDGDGKLYLDNFNIKRVPNEYKPKVNDINLGYVTPIEGTTILPGEDVTLTAHPLDGNGFAGWFANSTATTPITTDLTYTHTFDPSTSMDIEARFTAGEYAIQYAGFEGDPYKQHWVALCKHTDSGTGVTCYGTPWSIASPSSGGWQAVMVDHTAAHTGKASLCLSAAYASVGYTLTGLKPNTVYSLSYYLYAKTTGYVDGTLVLPGTTSIIKKDGEGKVLGYYGTTDPLVLGYSGSQNAPEWTNHKTTFNTGNNTEVTVWFKIANSSVQIDNISLFESIGAAASAYDDRGTVETSFSGDAVAKGTKIELKATPYGSNTFIGWYNESNIKVSSDATYTFTANTSFNLVAKFSGNDRPIVDFENPNYAHWQSICSHSTSAKGAITTNGLWNIASTFAGGWQALNINKATGHNSQTSLSLSCTYSMAGYTIRNLEPNTEYYVRYYASSEGGTMQKTYVLPEGTEPFSADKVGHISAEETLGHSGSYTLGSTWTAIDTVFNTGNNTNVTVWFFPIDKAVNIDNIEIRKGPVNAVVSGDIGGDIEVNFDGTMIYEGFEVSLKATPLKGNTFAGWYNENNDLVSSAANYTFTASSDFNLMAKFNGDNKPAVDMFAKQGYDGTFEKGIVPGWKAFSSVHNYSWCSGNVVSNDSFDGNKAYEYHAQWSTTILPLDGLKENTDYKLSFWVKLKCADNIANADIASIAIVNAGAGELGNASKTFVSTSNNTPKTKNNWHKFEYYFNSGDETAAELLVQYNGDTTSILFDNIEFHQFAANETLGNGNLENGVAKWVGDFDIVSNSGSNVLSIGEDKLAYQTIKVKEFTAYTVKFRAKGNLTAAALDATAKELTHKNLLTADSYTNVDGQTWTEYSYDVYSGSDSALSVAFLAGAGGAMVDDISVETKGEAAGSIFEHVDFETDRYSNLCKNTNSNAWSIYTATDANDTNVRSGKKSLKFSANASTIDLENRVEADFVGYQIGYDHFMKISISYKIPDGASGGAFYFSPDSSGVYGTDTGFEHSADDDEWHTAVFYVTNTTETTFKMVLSNIAGRTTGDVYIDDIIVEVAPSMVNETNTTKTYCERLYNAVENESFETTATSKDWAGLTNGVKIVSGKALKGKHYLEAKAGTHYVLEVDVKPGTIYYFGASVRGDATTKGYIGIASSASGNTLLKDKTGADASMVANKAGESGWTRSGFSFISAGSGKAYVVIDVDAGTLDIDSVMLFTSEYGYRYDPNDYTVYVPYDYDNLKSSTTVINGGYGSQPYYKKASTVIVEEEEVIEEDFDSAPTTGEKNVLPVALTILAVAAIAVILLAKKRKDGADNA